MTNLRTRVEAEATDGPVKEIITDNGSLTDVPPGIDMHKLFAQEAFMSEWVVIMLHPTQDTSEVGVPVSVNGNRAYIIPGKPCKIRRFHVAQLVKARPDVVIHRSDDVNAPESEHNRLYKHSTSRYNFDVLQDSAQGRAWLRELRSNTFQS